MNINIYLKKLAIKLERKKDPLFNTSIELQKKYLKSMKEVKNNIHRSFLQYKCQMKLNGCLISFFINLFSLPFIFYYYLKKEEIEPLKKKDAIFFRDGKPENILPNSLKKEFETIEKNPIEKFFLNTEDKKYIKKLFFHYPLSWHFILKTIIKIGKYRYCIEIYNPKAIIVCAEYSFTSSILTDFCEKNNIIHINVMHGEKLFYMRDSFFKFHRCYIWDKYYKELFEKMLAEESQFIVEIPESMKLKKEKTKKDIYDYTYYLGAEKDENLRSICKNLNILKNYGYLISIRPHPRYSDMNIIQSIFSDFNIENSKKISIESSLLQTKNVISLFSTVLNQALSNNIPIIIDDISNKMNYKKLYDLDYICLYKSHKLLSEIVEKEN